MKKLIVAAAAICGSLLADAAQPASAAIPGDAPAATTVNHPDWSRQAVIYEVNVRQFTPEGTFEAILPHIPRLKDLGVDILWFMPIHPISQENRKGKLGSYYAVYDYKGVNPEFGSIDDFRALVKAAHAAGMKVIIDWVPNHSGCDNAMVRNHPEYYARNEKGEMFGPYDWTDVYKLDYSNPEMRKMMTDAMQFWLREADIDGFRCDVASMVPVDFWNEARPKLEAVKPGLFMLAEASSPALQAEGFDMGYNWPLASLFKAIANNAGQYTMPDDPGKKEAAAIDSLLASQQAEYPGDTYLMNMITNHDFYSWEGTEFQRFGNLADAMAVLTYTLPGMPLIYTGQETGLNRALEFFKKDEAPQFEPRNSYFDFYQKLNALKHSQKALHAGAPGTHGGHIVRYPTKSPDLYIFSRQLDGSEVLVMTNLGSRTRKIKYLGESPIANDMINYFTGKHEKYPSSLKPGEYRVYVRPKYALNKPM